MTEKNEIRISKVTLWQITTAVLAVLFVISIFTNGFKFGNSNIAIIKEQEAQAAQPRAENPPSQPAAQKVDMVALADDDAVKGSSNVPVTIVEFSDYECPFCARFYQQTLPQIEEQYIKAGKVKLIYRDFPLSFHANAQKSAEAAECAGEQGKYYEMHNKLFDEGVNGGVESFKQYAKDLGLDTAKFNTCLDSGQMVAEVQKDFADGQKAGVSGTPSFFINGKPIVGAQPLEAFKQIIDAELAK